MNKQTSDELDKIEKGFEKDMGITRRFEIKHGNFGPYFYDTESGAMFLKDVLDRLNEIDPLKERLFAANKGKRGKKW